MRLHPQSPTADKGLVVNKLTKAVASVGLAVATSLVLLTGCPVAGIAAADAFGARSATAATYASPPSTSFWLATAAGNVWAFGDACNCGSAGAHGRLNRPIVGIAPTRTSAGYWEVASDGGVFALGNAHFYGSTGAVHLNKPIVSMTATPKGKGYWLVASDGGIFTFGDARFYGSTGAVHLYKPIISMTATPDGKGYWLLASDGGIFTFGDARFYGSMGRAHVGDPAQTMVSSQTGSGYWLFDQNGTAQAFGDASGTPPTEALMFNPVTPGDKAVLFAFLQLGKPYIWGGNGPAGFDCSGLALAAWEHGAGIGFARVANNQYHTAGTPVALRDLQAGDLVFWGSNHSDWTSVYHTGMYVGGGRIVESTGDHVQLNSLDQWGSSDLMPNGRRP
jgi:cell wall-associated NlpC family hydrolase